MPRTPLVLVALALAAAPLAALGPAAAQPSLGANIGELVVRFEDNRTADLWINATLDGAGARQLRLLSDTNFSGTVSDVEAGVATDLVRATLVDGSPELERARSSLLLDGGTPSDVGRLELRVVGLEGPTRSAEPAQAILTTRVTWSNATAPAANATAPGNETHVFRIPGDAVVSRARVAVEAPPGLQVRAAEGLDQAQTGAGDTVVTGWSEAGRAIEILFAPPPPPPEEEAASNGTEDRDVPMGGVGLVLVAAAAALLAARRRR